MAKTRIPYLIGKGLTALSLALFAIFTSLKLAGVIAWSWWLVFTPFILPFAFCIIVVLLAMCIVHRMRKEND